MLIDEMLPKNLGTLNKLTNHWQVTWYFSYDWWLSSDKKKFGNQSSNPG